MASAPTTLADLFGLGDEQGQAALRRAIADSPILDGLGKALGPIGGPLRDHLAGEVAAGVKGALGIPVVKAIVDGWGATREIRKALHDAPTERRALGLGKHRIGRDTSVPLHVEFNGQRVATLSLKLAVALKLEGASVTVQDRRLVEVQPGTVAAEGTAKLDGVEILKRASAPVALGGPFQLAEPVGGD